MQNLFHVVTRVEKERRRRIMLSLWAYAYEFEARPLVSDAVFDAECLKVDKTIKTGRLDDFFEKVFQAHTGMWIHSHPELDKVKKLYERLYL